MNSLDLIQPSWLDLAVSFSHTTLQRARQYARKGHVLRSQWLDGGEGDLVLEAAVLGSHRDVYRVRVVLTESGHSVKIESACTCPVGYNCKHAAAALIKALDLRPGAAGQTPEILRSMAACAEANMPHNHQQWLAAIEALGSNASQGAAAATHKLVVEISVNPYRSAALQLLYGALRPDGTLTGLTAANRDWEALLNSRPRYLAEHDHAPIRRLLLACERTSSGRRLERDVQGLRQWVDAGKAVIMQAPGRYTPLSWGPARSARSLWRMDDQGQQRFDLAVETEAKFFIAEGLWYLDGEQAQIGPLQADVAMPLARVLLQAPPIEAQHVPNIAQRLQSVLQALPAEMAHIPLPQTLTEHSVKTKGIVHVHLGSDEYRPMARVQVHYDNLAVGLHDSGAARLRDSALLRPVLDAKLHQKVRRQIEKTGLQYIRDAADASQFIAFNEDIALALMHIHLPQWQKQGWVVSLDPDFRWQIVDASALSLDSEFDAQGDWFSADLGVDIDGQRVSLLPILAELLHDREFLAAINSGQIDSSATHPVHLRIDAHRLVAMPYARLHSILSTLIELHQLDVDKPIALRFARTDVARLQALADHGIQWNAPEPLLQLAQQLKNFTHIEPVPTPSGLRAQLRPYQQAGLAWMQFLRAHTLSGILADDMGLGKTVQAIAHILAEKNAGRLTAPALVIAPTSVVHNWHNELTRFAPQLSVLTLHGAGRAHSFDQLAHQDVIISSYALLPRDIEALQEQRYHLIIFDEAQYLKNARTRASEAAMRLRASHRLALSGTPVENNLGELWALFHLLLPGFLGDSRRFAQLYRTPIEKQGNAQRQQHLSRRIKPFILRRTKDLVAQELPPKTEIEHPIELAGAQRDLYETVRATMQKRVRDILAAKGLAQSHIVVLDALLKLRQVCCDPRLVRAASAKKTKSSAKLERLMELLPELIAEGRRILLFSQFTSMLELIEPCLKEAGIDFVRLTGETKDRKTPVERFQKGEVPLFLISLKAGGTGLNLTAADTVIHYDPWWNPAVENQATDRAHRIGQDKPVFVHRLITAGTVEERIRAMQQRKASLAKGILDEDAALSKALSAQDFEALFEPLQT